MYLPGNNHFSLFSEKKTIYYLKVEVHFWQLAALIGAILILQFLTMKNFKRQTSGLFGQKANILELIFRT